jgi:hypothetical protein
MSHNHRDVNVDVVDKINQKLKNKNANDITFSEMECFLQIRLHSKFIDPDYVNKCLHSVNVDQNDLCFRPRFLDGTYGAPF